MARNRETLEEELEPEVKRVQIRKAIEQIAIETPTQSEPKAKECARHFGYLSKRAPNEKIPEDCMVCENIVQCMLKNVTG